jgi:coenzyme F420-reducing hydrogenase gamma subunit
VSAGAQAKPSLAVWKFASCDGCQLTLLNCEDELFAVADELDVRFFLEASSAVVDGPYDVSLVEGSITTESDVERILEVRRQSRYVIAVGACATAGGIQALRNGRDIGELTSIVYATPDFIDTLDTSTPIGEHIAVDFELRGCPIDRTQLIEVIGAFLARRKPNISAHSVCIDCKQRHNSCVMVADGIACLGPVTHAGCGAICPAYNRGCYGCFGPAETANLPAMVAALTATGMPRDRIDRLLTTFHPDSWGERHPDSWGSEGDR